MSVKPKAIYFILFIIINNLFIIIKNLIKIYFTWY